MLVWTELIKVSHSDLYILVVLCCVALDPGDGVLLQRPVPLSSVTVSTVVGR